MLQGRFVAPVGQVALGAREKAPLDALAGGEILLLHGAQGEFQVAPPMLVGARTGGRLGNVELEEGHALVDFVVHGKHTPDFSVIALHDDDRVREQDVHNRRVFDQIPCAFRQFAHLADAAPGERLADVESEWMKQAHVVQKNRSHRLGVQHREMVRLEKSIDEHLPVHAPMQNPCLVIVIAIEAVAGEFGTETVEFLIDIEVRAWFGLNPDAAETLAGGQLDQAVCFPVDALEVPGVGNSNQFASMVVAPAVIRADEIAFRVTATLGDLCPPMAADIQKGPHLAVIAAHDENRYTAVVVGEIVTDLRNSTTEAHHQRVTAKQDAHLAIEPLGIGIICNSVATDLVGETGGARVDVREQMPRELDLQ